MKKPSTVSSTLPGYLRPTAAQEQRAQLTKPVVLTPTKTIRFATTQSKSPKTLSPSTLKRVKRTSAVQALQNSFRNLQAAAFGDTPAALPTWNSHTSWPQEIPVENCHGSEAEHDLSSLFEKTRQSDKIPVASNPRDWLQVFKPQLEANWGDWEVSPPALSDNEPAETMFLTNTSLSGGDSQVVQPNLCQHFQDMPVKAMPNTIPTADGVRVAKHAAQAQELLALCKKAILDRREALAELDMMVASRQDENDRLRDERHQLTELADAVELRKQAHQQTLIKSLVSQIQDLQTKALNTEAESKKQSEVTAEWEQAIKTSREECRMLRDSNAELQGLVESSVQSFKVKVADIYEDKQVEVQGLSGLLKWHYTQEDRLLQDMSVADQALFILEQDKERLEQMMAESKKLVGHLVERLAMLQYSDDIDCDSLHSSEEAEDLQRRYLAVVDILEEKTLGLGLEDLGFDFDMTI